MHLNTQPHGAIRISVNYHIRKITKGKKRASERTVSRHHSKSGEDGYGQPRSRTDRVLIISMNGGKWTKFNEIYSPVLIRFFSFCGNIVLAKPIRQFHNIHIPLCFHWKSRRRPVSTGNAISEFANDSTLPSFQPRWFIDMRLLQCGRGRKIATTTRQV